MTNSAATGGPQAPRSDDPDQDGAGPLDRTAPRSGDLRELLPVLTFLRQELRRSAGMLRDLAGCLSEQLCAGAAISGDGSPQLDFSAAVVALQNEDRIQQRLHDSEAVLSLLEQMLATGQPAVGSDLDRAVIDSLLLEETRGAFAASRGLSEGGAAPQDSARKPSAGDVDLF